MFNIADRIIIESKRCIQFRKSIDSPLVMKWVWIESELFQDKIIR